jgi:CBS domain-containing protein
MQIAEVMSRNVETVTPQTTVTEAARMMRAGDFGALPVAEGDRLIGVVTDRDIVVRILGNEMDANRATVGDAMTGRVLYVFQDEDAADVARNMAEQQVRRMPVVNRDKRLVGIVALGDLAHALPGEIAGQTLDTVSKG